MPANAPAWDAPQFTHILGNAANRPGSGADVADIFAVVQVDEAWVARKFALEFNAAVIQSLRKGVYAIGQGGGRWFSGGGGLSIAQTSTLLDYLVLVELLIQCRGDLEDYRDDLFDCRDQLLMQLRRSTEDTPSQVLPIVEELVAEFARRLGVG
jgi:hypothetical protein